MSHIARHLAWCIDHHFDPRCAHIAQPAARLRPAVPAATAVTAVTASSLGAIGVRTRSQALSALAAVALGLALAAPAAQADDAPASATSTAPSSAPALVPSPAPSSAPALVPSSASAAATAALQALMSNLPVVAQASSAASSGSLRGASAVTVANASGYRSNAAMPVAATGSPLAEGLRSVTVQRGETLDRVIRRSLPDLPLHPDFLRQAFVKLNPHAFPSGRPHLMRAGAVLQVPGMADLRALMLAQHPQAAGLLQTPDMTEHGPNGHAASDKRRWVRFP